MKEKMVAVLSALSLMGTLAGCSALGENVGDKAEQKYTDIAATSGGDNKVDSGMEFVYVTQDSANPYFIQVYDGSQSKYAELRIRTQILDFEYDVVAQVSYVKDAVQRGVDEITIPPLNENVLRTVMDQAKEGGIVVSIETQPANSTQIDDSLDEYNIGYAIDNVAAEWIRAEQGGRGRALVPVQDDAETVTRRGDGTNDGTLENAPRAKVVAGQNASNTDLGMKVTESVLLIKPEVNVICACDSFTTVGAYEAVSAMQKIPDNSHIGGYDATDEGKGKMKVENSVYRSSCNLFPYEVSEDLAKAMYKYLTKKQEDAVVQRRYEPV